MCSTSAWFGDLGDGIHKGDQNDPRVAVIKVVPEEIRYWLSTSNTLRAREAYFADRATQAVSGATMTTQSTSVLHTIQAEVLLANYFFSTSRLLEGRYHTLAAVALATGSRYHQLDLGTMSGDPVGAGEKIRAFWTVVAVDKAWAAAMNSPPSLSHSGRTGVRVTTPWPLTAEAYEQVGTDHPSVCRTAYSYRVSLFRACSCLATVITR